MSRPNKSKQTFVTSTVKLALDKDLISKTLDRDVRVELKVVSYICKNVLLTGEKVQRKRKRDGNERWKKEERVLKLYENLNTENCLK